MPYEPECPSKDFSSGSVVKNSAQVPFLVGEIRPHMPCGQKTKTETVL